MQFQGFQIGVKRLQIGTNRFQISAEFTNRGKRDFKSGKGLQIEAEQLVHQINSL